MTKIRIWIMKIMLNAVVKWLWRRAEQLLTQLADYLDTQGTARSAPARTKTPPVKPVRQPAAERLTAKRLAAARAG